MKKTRSQYKRDISREFFLSLNDFKNRAILQNKSATIPQQVLARNLHRSYGLPEKNILHSVVYADVAFNRAKLSEHDFNLLDANSVAQFENGPESIQEIVFKANDKNIEIRNPYFIDKLYYYLLEITDSHFDLSQRKIFGKLELKKKRPSATIIKKIATELFNEFTQVEKISAWKSYCIVGYIFCFYKISLKSEDPILNEQEFNLKKEKYGLDTGTYLQYLSGRIKRYIKN